jgi:hypothetical protein
MLESTSNVEFANKVIEHGHLRASAAKSRSKWVEIAEAIVLAVVATSTAWSSYQAAKWDALSAENYSLASRTTVLSQEKSTLAGQDRLYDITTFNSWVLAKTSGNARLATYFQRRFRPEYATAFAAWQALDPLNNRSAPAGPIFMAEYTDANGRESANLAQEAQAYFQKAVSTRETGDKYVRVTVFLATVLLLTALSQRFEILGPRVAVVTVAFVLLIVSTYWILTYPRA